MKLLEERFKGITLHSTQYKRASDFPGKKVLVIGAGNSGVLLHLF